MTEKKPVKCGLDYIRGPGWKPLVRTHRGALYLARRRADKALRAIGFQAVVVDCGAYWRICYGKK